jgi:hypothetical protein
MILDDVSIQNPTQDNIYSFIDFKFKSGDEKSLVELNENLELIYSKTLKFKNFDERIFMINNNNSDCSPVKFTPMQRQRVSSNYNGNFMEKRPHSTNGLVNNYDINLNKNSNSNSNSTDINNNLTTFRRINFGNNNDVNLGLNNNKTGQDNTPHSENINNLNYYSISNNSTSITPNSSLLKGINIQNLAKVKKIKILLNFKNK